MTLYEETKATEVSKVVASYPEEIDERRSVAGVEKGSHVAEKGLAAGGD